jgi:hypothetical protein
MLIAGANINYKDAAQKTPLMIAVPFPTAITARAVLAVLCSFVFLRRLHRCFVHWTGHPFAFVMSPAFDRGAATHPFLAGIRGAHGLVRVPARKQRRPACAGQDRCSAQPRAGR